MVLSLTVNVVRPETVDSGLRIEKKLDFPRFLTSYAHHKFLF